jgi:hypothetical protein
MYVSALSIQGRPGWLGTVKNTKLRSPLMKTQDWSVETLGREYTSRELCIQLYKPE